MLKAAVLDRDGTIIEDRHYLSDPDGVALLPGAVEGLRLLAGAGMKLVVASNQSGVGRGYYTLDDIAAVNREMERRLAERDVVLDGIYFCPHGPEEDCDCRKPKPGMILRAASELGFDPAQCVVIGDKLSDLLCGRAVDALTVLVRTGKGLDEASRLDGEADIVADNLEQASRAILAAP